MLGIGTDIVDLRRIDPENEHFARRILTDAEYAVFESLTDHRKREYLGGRFAGKEAYLKAKGLGLGGMGFHDIEILNLESGQPYLNDPDALISLSHEKDYAVAFVVIR